MTNFHFESESTSPTKFQVYAQSNDLPQRFGLTWVSLFIGTAELLCCCGWINHSKAQFFTSWTSPPQIYKECLQSLSGQIELATAPTSNPSIPKSVPIEVLEPKIDREVNKQELIVRYRCLKRLKESELTLEDQLFLENFQIAMRILWGVTLPHS